MSTSEIEYTLVVNTTQFNSDIRKVESSLMRILSYVSMLNNGDPHLQKLIENTQRTINLMRSLQLAIRAVQLASGPVGWLYAGTSIIGAGLSGYGLYESLRSQ